jgi:hypothetical protein
LQKYEEWLKTQPELIERMRKELKGKVLGCWCVPNACHGDIILKYINMKEEDK